MHYITKCALLLFPMLICNSHCHYPSSKDDELLIHVYYVDVDLCGTSLYATSSSSVSVVVMQVTDVFAHFQVELCVTKVSSKLLKFITTI